MIVEREFSKLTRTICLLLCTALVSLGAIGCEKEEPPPPVPPAEVHAITVKPQTVPVSASFVAQIESAHQVDIVARVNGFLEKILYEEGEVVKEGQDMFLIDQKPFLAQVESAKGALENNQAQLWTAEVNLERIQPLVQLDAASKSDLDQAIGAVKSARAAVHQAEANLKQATLDLSYTEIKSPVTGVSGEAEVREGTYLSIGPGGYLTYVALLDPIWVNFSISQNQVSNFDQDVEAGRIIPPPNDEFTIQLYLSDNSKYPHTGKLSFVDPTFNPDTGTFLIRAELPNPDTALRPGMFVKAELHGAKRANALVVPQRAVQQTSNGHVVFLVNKEGTAEVRPVIVGPWTGDDWIIDNGLTEGEVVITDGFMRLAPGMPVKVLAADARKPDATKPEATKQQDAAPQAPEQKSD